MSLASVEVPNRVPFPVQGNSMRDGSESTGGRDATTSVNRGLSIVIMEHWIQYYSRKHGLLSCSMPAPRDMFPHNGCVFHISGAHVHYLPLLTTSRTRRIPIPCERQRMGDRGAFALSRNCALGRGAEII